MKKNKILPIVLSAILTAALSGCSGDSDGSVKLDPENPVSITVWHYYNGLQQTTFDSMVETFNNTVGAEQGIIVTAVSKSSIDDLAESVINSVNNDITTETPPSIFAAYSETAYKLDQMGALADMKKYTNDETLNTYIKAYIDEGVFADGSLKIFPIAKSTEVMMINKTDWDKFAAAEGVTEDDMSTMEDLTATAEKYYEYTDGLTPDIPNDGKALFGRDSVANYMYIGAKQLGEDYFSIDENGNAAITITKDTLKKLWDNYYVPYVKGYFTSEGKYRSDDAKTGTIISLVCSTSGAAYFPSEVTFDDDSTYKIENTILPVPRFKDAEPYIVQQGAGMSIMKSDEKTEYASMKFLEWFSEEERNIEFSINSGYLPVKKDANNYEKIAAQNEKLEKPMDDKMLGTLRTAIDQINSSQLYTSPPFGKSTEARDYIGNAMEDTAEKAQTEAYLRISVGEDKDAVFDEYTNNEAFEKWYTDFISGLEAIIS